MFVVCWFLAIIFGGSLETCMNAVVICGACDEEMFTREQRFMEPDLIELLDAILEEQTEQQQEAKAKLKVAAPKNHYKTHNNAESWIDSFRQATPMTARDDPVILVSMPEGNQLPLEPSIFQGQKPNEYYRPERFMASRDLVSSHGTDKEEVDSSRPMFSR